MVICAMTLLDQIHVAQNLTYTLPPGKTSLDEYTEEEVFEATLASILHDPTITYGVIVGCRKHLPIKILVKQLLKRYITKFTPPPASQP